MSWGGAGQRSAYGLHKLNQHPAGAKVVQEPPRSGSQTTRAEVLDGNPDAERIKQFIQRVNNLQGQSVSSTRPDPKLNVHTAHLLVFMFPTTNRIVGGGDTLDAQLTTWKGHFKEQMNEKGLAEALKKMGFQVSKDVPKLLMSAFQEEDQPCSNKKKEDQLSTIHNIDYNYFIKCCIFAEKYFTKAGSTSSSASSPGLPLLQNAAKQDVAQNSKQSTIITIK